MSVQRKLTLSQMKSGSSEEQQSYGGTGGKNICLFLSVQAMNFQTLIFRMSINYHKFVGFEVISAVVVKSSIFWDIMPCILLKVNRLEEHVTSILRVEE
jgi:hypothetical protein